MKELIIAVLVTFHVFGAIGQQDNHVVLLSIDGFRPEMYRDKSWPTPNLQILKERGTYADHLNSVFPSYTYPSHTAMLTGALPARSGICYNQPKNSQGEWNWFADSIRVPTLWKVLKEKGLVTAGVEWPVGVSKDITYNVPEIWSDRYPDRITEARKYATPGLIEEIEENATGKLDSVNMNEDAFSMDDNSARMAAYVFKTRQPSLLAVHFAEVDGMEHEYGRDGDSVRLAIAAVDHCVGVILEAIKESGLQDSTTVLIVGDHGFATIHQVMRPNMLIKSLPASFIAAGGSCFLYGRDKNVASMVVDSLKALPKDKRKLFRIIERKELDRMGADSAALLALAAVPGMVFSGSMGAGTTVNHGPGTSIQENPLDGVFVPASGGHHGYDPNEPQMWTGFIAAGAGIRKGSRITELCVTDIAPLIAKLLGVEFVCADGRLVEGILK